MGLGARELEAATVEYSLVCRLESKSERTIDHYDSVIKLFIKYPFVLSEEEISELLRVARRNPRDYAILLFLLDTGVRASELTGLRVDDIDLSTMSAKVFGKGGKSRTVFFSQTTARALGRWMSKRPDTSYEDIFFLSQRGGELTISGLRQMLKSLQERSSIKDKKVCPHVLRYCFATMYAKEGGDPHSLACLMGHTSTKMVEVYVYMVGRDLAVSLGRWSPVEKLKCEGKC